MEFRPIALADRKLFEAAYRTCRHEGSECSFTNLFIWRKPLEIVWRDASNLEIAVPNLAFVGDLPSEAFGVTVHVRFVPDDPEARRKHFEARGR